MKKLTDLSTPEVGAITRIFRAHGTNAARVRRTAAMFNITESDARALGTAATTTAPKKAVTESAPDLRAADAATDAVASRKASLAFRLHQQVNEAEAKPLAECSTQELEALAAAAGADAGMFG